MNTVKFVGRRFRFYNSVSEKIAFQAVLTKIPTLTKGSTIKFDTAPVNTGNGSVINITALVYRLYSKGTTDISINI